MLEKNKQIYEMVIDADNFNKERFKDSARVYRLTFNFCLKRMTDSLLKNIGSLYEKERESVTFNKLRCELYENIVEKNYINLQDAHKSVHVSLINNAIMSSVGFFNKWKRERLKSQDTIPFPKMLSKKDKQFFVIGSRENPVSFSSKGLYLRKLARFKILGSNEDKKSLIGTYSSVKVFYKNLTCQWYCQFDFKNKID